MASREVALSAIAEFIPQGAVEPIIDYLQEHRIHLKIRRERKTKYGDYRPAYRGNPHIITVNGNLNQYHFLITLLHEIAHLLTHVQYGRNVLPHGVEWKNSFSDLIHKFSPLAVFPEDVLLVLLEYARNPAASSCSNPALFKVLKRYDARDEGALHVSDLAIGDVFRIARGDQFRVLEKKRTRYICENTTTRIKYLFPAIHEVFKENKDL